MMIPDLEGFYRVDDGGLIKGNLSVDSVKRIKDFAEDEEQKDVERRLDALIDWGKKFTQV